MPQVTVLTAVRNGARFLGQTLDCIRAQTFEDWEHVVVDDASIDDSPSIVARAAAGDPRIRLISRTTCGGPFAAANEGLRHARGRYIVRNDADDLSLPMRIEAQLAFLREHPGLKGCASDAQLIGSDRPGWRLPRTPGEVAWSLCFRCVLHHSTACIEREALDAIGGYREAPYAQDYRLWCDLARRRWIGVVPEVLVQFRRHDQSITRTRPAEQRAESLAILADHLQTLTGLRWKHEDVEALYAVGRELHWPFDAGLRAIRLLVAARRADRTLDAGERRDLMREAVEQKLAFLAQNLRFQPLALAPYLWARASLRLRARGGDAPYSTS